MATMTINTSGADDAILAPAFGQYLNLPGNANAAQIKSATIAWLRSVALVYQTQQAAAGITPISPT